MRYFLKILSEVTLQGIFFVFRKINFKLFFKRIAASVELNIQRFEKRIFLLSYLLL